MKRLPEAISLCCILIALLTSGTAEMRSDKTTGLNSSYLPVHDTTGLTRLLKVDTFHLEIIPPASGVQFFKDGIVFLSNTKFEGKMLPKHVSFGSIEAYTGIVKDTSLGIHVIFSPYSSFSFPCEATTFSSDFRIMYFTKIGKKEKKEKIYYAEYKPNEKGEPGWIENESPLDFCTGNSIYTHPALSPDGKVMIFASDMSGTAGGLDLFITKKSGEKWSKPENIGKSINTVRNECFPFIDKDNNLFFSSDGLAGYGGYDIFTCKFNGEAWEKPTNLSGRINSENDDIAFTINRSDGKNAFFTKRRTSAMSQMQLFRITLKKEPAENNNLSISYIFNGSPSAKTEPVVLTAATENVKPTEKEAVKTTPPMVKKEVKTEVKNTPSETTPKPGEAKVVIIKNTSELPAELKDKVIYRVQFLSSTNAQKDKQIVMNGITYKTYEYFYLNSYRYTIGEFTTLSPAKELQSIVRKSGYPTAFVAAFKNETRSLDLTLFK